MTARIRKMTQDTKSEHKQSKMVEKKCMDERKKDRDQPPTKVVIRRLPPSLTPEVFLEQVSPLPSYDYFYFVKADMSLGSNAFTRAYINFPCSDDIYNFKDKFDDYVFVDKKGNEFPAVVEFAPFQKVPKKKMRKADTKKGTIEQDGEYQKFLDILKNPETEPTVPIEAYLEELENKKKELKANHGVPKMTTPLIEYIRRKKEEKKANIQRQREDRKKREHERKKAREEEKRRRKEKEKEKREEKKQKEKDMMLKKDDPPIKLLKNPDRELEKQKEECDFGRMKDEPEKPIKERGKLRFSKENRDRQGQERLKSGRDGRFGDRSKYSKDDRLSDKPEKYKSNKDDRSSDKKNREDKGDRQKHLTGRDKYNREDHSKCYQSVNINNSNNNSNNCREDKKMRHDKQSKHDRGDKYDRPEKQDKYERMDRQDKFDRCSDKQDRLDRLKKHERSEKQDNNDFEKSVHEKKSNKTDKLDKAKICSSHNFLERPERPLYDPRKALERRQQSESARQQHHDKNGTGAGSEKLIYSEGKSGCQLEKMSLDRRERNEKGGKGGNDKGRTDNGKGSGEKCSFVGKGSGEKSASRKSNASSLDGGSNIHNSSHMEMSNSMAEDNKGSEVD